VTAGHGRGLAAGGWRVARVGQGFRLRNCYGGLAVAPRRRTRRAEAVSPANTRIPIVLALLTLVCVPVSGRDVHTKGGASASRHSAASTPAFDSNRAFEHIRQLVSIGPRPAGSPGLEQARRYINDQMKLLGLTVVEQPFEAQTPLGTVRMVNLSVTIPGAASGRLILAGHYDTKLFRQFRFVGANDGGSSTAMLLELARVLKGRKNAFPIELVFFDGEEAFIDWTGTDHTYGSRHYVEAARAAGTLRGIRAMILVDMIGDRNLNIRRESESTTWLTDLIWASAKRLGHGDNFLDEPMQVADDHVAFLEAGIPAVDIIDLDYAAWHTASDTLDSVSARSLQVVGDVLLDALPKIEERIARSNQR
jgi:peptidase M28-like protein